MTCMRIGGASYQCDSKLRFFFRLRAGQSALNSDSDSLHDISEVVSARIIQMKTA